MIVTSCTYGSHLQAEGRKAQEDFEQKACAFDAQIKKMRQEILDVRSAADKDTTSLKAVHRSEVQAINTKHQAVVAALQRELEGLKVRSIDTFVGSIFLYNRELLKPSKTNFKD